MHNSYSRAEPVNNINLIIFIEDTKPPQSGLHMGMLITKNTKIMKINEQ